MKAFSVILKMWNCNIPLHDLDDHGKVLKAGWGEGPTNEEQAAIVKPYEIYKQKKD